MDGFTKADRDGFIEIDICAKKHRKGNEMKKYISTVLAAMLLTQVAYASDIKTVRNISGAEFEISGSAASGTAVTIDIFAPGKSAADLDSAAKPMDVIKYHDEVYAGEDGTFSFTSQLEGESGIYPAYITIGGEKNVVNLEFINAGESGNVLSGLNSAADIKQYISENRANLGFFMPLYDEVERDEVCKMLKAKLPLDTGKPEEAVRIFNEAVAARAITEKKLNGVSAVESYMGLLNNGSKYDTWYALADKSGVDSRLNGRSITSVDAFENMLGEAIVLEIVKTPNGYENVRKIIADFAEEIGIKNPTDKAIVYQSLAGKNYSSYAELKKAYNEYLSSASGTTGGGGGGGGSSSGKGSSKGSSTTSGAGVSFRPEQNIQKIEKDWFSDMENAAWAKPAVYYLAEKKIVSGKTETEFYPNDYINREEFVAMIVRAFDFKVYADTNQFTDVTKDDWYYDSVLAAFQNEIVSGVSEDSFGTGERITRQDMAAILWRVINEKKIELAAQKEQAAFEDDAQIRDYAKEAVAELRMRGIVSGDNNRFEPLSPATRAQAAQMIYKIMSQEESK